MVLALLLLLPVMVGLGAWLGYLASPELSRVHYTVRLAERLWAEQQGQVEGTSPPSDAFYRRGEPNEGLYLRAGEIRRQFDVGSAILGGYAALVVGTALIGLTVRRRRDVYEIDHAACVACGRCYRVCPVQRELESERAAAAQ